MNRRKYSYFIRLFFVAGCFIVLSWSIRAEAFVIPNIETGEIPSTTGEFINAERYGPQIQIVDSQDLKGIPSLSQAQEEVLEAYNVMVDSNKTLEERTEAAYRLIALLATGVLDYDANFVHENGWEIIDGLYQFTVGSKKNDDDFTQAVAGLFEKLYLTAIFEDIAYEANMRLIAMQSQGIELPEFFAYSPSEFKMHELSEYDRAIIKNAGTKVSQDNLRSHIEEIQELKLEAEGSSYPFFNDPAREYLYNYLCGLGIDTKIVEYHDSGLDTQMRPIKNIVATIPGTLHPEKKIVLTAHYDSIVSEGFYHLPDKISPGAEDNASGVAVLLEIARILKEEMLPLEYTVEIVLFDYEEHGLNGSQAYVRHALINQEEIIGVLNFDMVGFDGGDGMLELITVGESESFLNEGVCSINAISQRDEFILPILDNISDLAGTGDYSSFWGVDLYGRDLKRGYYYAVAVAGAWLADNKEYEYYHSQEDTIDKLDLDFLEKVTQWAIEVVYGLANPVG